MDAPWSQVSQTIQIYTFLALFRQTCLLPKSFIAEDDFSFSRFSAFIDSTDKSDSRSCLIESPKIIFYQF